MWRNSILVAIGANLEGPGGRSPVETCEWAVDRVAGLAGVGLVGRSGWYRSAPVPVSGQPDYVNGVVRLEGDVSPHGLLAALHGIEAEAGRVREVVNGARTLDLDLVAVDGLVIDDPVLRLPHPRMAERGFVLVPLCDVAGDWVHPVLGRTALELLAVCGQGGVAGWAGGL